MGKTTRAGRPPKDDRGLSKELILKTALPIIRKHGAKAISFRRLSRELGVTPMAIKYHVVCHKKLLADLVDIAFDGIVDVTHEEPPIVRIRRLLRAYCVCALNNAELVQCMLADPSLMSAEIVALTGEVRKNTQILNKGDAQDVMLNLLMDYTHGFVFSAASAPTHRPLTENDFLRSLDWLLDNFHH